MQPLSCSKLSTLGATLATLLAVATGMAIDDSSSFEQQLVTERRQVSPRTSRAAHAQLLDLEPGRL